MKAPLPEVPPLSAPKADKSPPPLLKALIWLSILTSFAEWAADYPTKDYSGHLIYAVIYGIVSLLYWKLWIGRAWARYTMCVLCFVGLIFTFLEPLEQTPIEYVVGMMGNTVAIALFVYLLTPAMHRYFHSS